MLDSVLVMVCIVCTLYTITITSTLINTLVNTNHTRTCTQTHTHIRALKHKPTQIHARTINILTHICMCKQIPSGDIATSENGADFVIISCKMMPKLYTSPFTETDGTASRKCSGAVHNMSEKDKLHRQHVSIIFASAAQVLYLLHRFCICYTGFVSATQVLYLLYRFCLCFE